MVKKLTSDENTTDILSKALGREKFEKHRELDFSFGVANLGRFRTNAFVQRGTIAAVMRLIPFEVHSFRELGLPADVCEKIASLKSGLVLCTGSTGSGKSTTLASIVDHINEAPRC